MERSRPVGLGELDLPALRHPDQVAGFGEGLGNRSVDAEGYTPSSLTEGAVQTPQTIDPLGKISTMPYDASENVLSARDPNGVGYDTPYRRRRHPWARTKLTSKQYGEAI